jgi:hypothetical protein
MLIAVLALAAAQAPQAAPAQESTKPAKVCRENERHTGTRIRSSRICKTQEQWDIDDEARDRRPLALQVKSDEPKPTE